MLGNGRNIFLLIFSISIFAFQTYSVAQINPHQHFGIEEGIISSNVFDIDQDPNGYLWFATDNGLSMYDGINFLNYSNKELGINSYISSINCIESNTILFGCGVNGIYQFDVLTKKAKRINQSPISQSNKLIVAEGLVMSLHDYHTIEILSLKTGNLLFTDSLLSKTNVNYPLTISKTQDGTIFVGRSDGIYKFNNEKLRQERVFQELVNFPVYSIYKDESGKLYLGSDNKVYVIFNGEIVDLIKLNFAEESRIRNIVVDQYGKLWLSVWGGTGAYVIDNGKINDVNYFLNFSIPGISRFFKDVEGNLWIGTTGKGLYLFKNHFIVNYPTQGRFPNSNVRRIELINNGLLLGTAEGLGFFNLTNDSISHSKHLVNYSQFVRDICRVTADSYVVAITDLRFKESLKKSYLFNGNVSIRYIHASSLYYNKNSLHAGNWDGEISLIDARSGSVISTIDSIPPASIKSKRIDAIYIDKNNTLWAGGQFGLCLIDSNFNKKHLIDHFSGISIIKIQQQSINKVDVLTSSGLKIYNVDPDLDLIRVVDSISLSNVTSYVKLGNNSFAFGTNEGIYFYDDGFKGRLTVFDGLISESISDLYFDASSRRLYAATAEGLIKLNQDEVMKYFKYQYNIDQVYIDLNQRRIQDHKGVFKFNYTIEPINIIIRSVRYSNSKTINYRARFDSNEWFSLKDGIWRLHSLQPGKYNIEVEAGVYGRWGPTSKYSLNVIPPFYRTTLFYFTLIVVFLLLSIYLSLRIRRNKLRANLMNQELLNSLNEYKQKALSSNLNPHFIFNALNSVQNYISKSDTSGANEYLSLFARLVRSHINYSDSGFIKLSNEIERLKMYLEFERIRLSNSFSYNIEVGPNLDANSIEIPSMIIQPFVENSIWHAFSELKENGVLKITIAKPPVVYDDTEGNIKNLLTICIEDNGAGIDTSKTSKHGFQSMGVQLVRERLVSLDPECGNPITFHNNQPGTKVIIRLTGKAYQVVAAQL
jgi:ligand-binding sensor domain-containing protein